MLNIVLLQERFCSCRSPSYTETPSWPAQFHSRPNKWRKRWLENLKISHKNYQVEQCIKFTNQTVFVNSWMSTPFFLHHQFQNYSILSLIPEKGRIFYSLECFQFIVMCWFPPALPAYFHLLNDPFYSVVFNIWQLLHLAVVTEMSPNRSSFVGRLNLQSKMWASQT